MAPWRRRGAGSGFKASTSSSTSILRTSPSTTTPSPERPTTLDLTGGRATPVYASKIPDHRGLTLTSAVELKVKDTEVRLSRNGTGGLVDDRSRPRTAPRAVFSRWSPNAATARGRASCTGWRPVLFILTSSNFRAKLGQFLGSACTSVQAGPPSQFCVRVAPRVNIGNAVSAKFVVRDSAQVATRVRQPECGPDFTNTLGLTETRDHCGGMSIWDVASGGRMGMVTGEDATEVANSPTDCVRDCQGQNQVRGRLAVLGFPFPVPAASKLTPRISAAGLTAPLTR